MRAIKTRASSCKLQEQATGCKLQATTGHKLPAAWSLEPGACGLNHCRGQSALEYAMVVALVAGAVLLMQPYVRRAMQAHYKMVEIQLNDEVQDPDDPE